MCKLKPEKGEKERTRLPLGGDFFDFTVSISAPTASVTTEKCVFYSVVSTPGAIFLLADIKKLLEPYLNRPRTYAYSIESYPTGNC